MPENVEFSERYIRILQSSSLCNIVNHFFYFPLRNSIAYTLRHHPPSSLTLYFSITARTKANYLLPSKSFT